MRIEREPDAVCLRAEGEWVLAAVTALDRQIAALGPLGPAVVIDLSGLGHLDTAGAWLLARTHRGLEAGGARVRWTGVPERFAPILGVIEAECKDRAAKPPPVPGLARVLEHFGRGFIGAVMQGVTLLAFFGRVWLDSVATIRHPSRLRWAAIVTQIEDTGLNAMPILGLLSFLIGVVLAYQSAEQLHQYSADIFTVNLLAVSIFRELGAMLTAVIVAGRSGSAFTAEIGVMRVNEETDAIESLGLDIVEVLVLPRLIGLLVALPLLTFFANFAGLFGGAVVCFFSLEIQPSVFLHQLQSAVTAWTFWIGIIKTPFFAFLIVMVGCLNGLRVEQNAQSVGQFTTRSVVESLFLVIVSDALFSILFVKLGI